MSIILESPDSLRPETIVGTDLLVVEARSAPEYRDTVARVVDGTGEVPPAIVGTVGAAFSGASSIGDLNGENPFDALLVLPQPVSLVSAQLSTVLHSRRRHMRQLEAALQQVDLSRTILQEQAFGGLKPAYKRRLREFAESFERNPNRAAKIVSCSANIKPGTRLIRHWDDQTHQVTVARRVSSPRITAKLL